ncbi:hypothetical protein ACP0SG_06130 [Campylobacter lari]
MKLSNIVAWVLYQSELENYTIKDKDIDPSGVIRFLKFNKVH